MSWVLAGATALFEFHIHRAASEMSRQIAHMTGQIERTFPKPGGGAKGVSAVLVERRDPLPHVVEDLPTIGIGPARQPDH